MTSYYFWLGRAAETIERDMTIAEWMDLHFPREVSLDEYYGHDD